MVTTPHDNPPGSMVEDLEAAISGEVRFDAGSRATYSTDASNYRHVPIGVVIPRDEKDVIAAVAIARSHGVPITSRGGGTSLAGQACNEAVVIDYSKYMDRVIEIDPEKRLAVVQPGCVLDTLREEASRYGLTFGPDPATHSRNTLGGMIGNNSCGVRSVMSSIYGPGPMTVHQVLQLEVLTYRGQLLTIGPSEEEDANAICSGADEKARIYRALRKLRDDHHDEIVRRFPDIPRRASGYNLDWLLAENGFDVAKSLVGTEGTCVVVLRATVQLIEAKPERSLVVLAYDDAASAADDVPEIMEHGPVGLEGVDSKLVEFMKKKGLHPNDVEMLPEGGGWLLVEFGADSKEEADDQAARFADSRRSEDEGGPTVEMVPEPERQAKLWEVRESGLGATAHVPGMDQTHPGWEDSAVPPEQLGDYLRDLTSLFEEFDYQAALYGHFGQGCVHCRIDFDFTSDQGVARFREFLDRAADLVVARGGSLSGEHGDGQARGALLEKMFGNEIVGAFHQFRSIWDPDGMMNPGKVVDAPEPGRDLRQGPGSQPIEVETRFAYPEDDGSFAKATTRCVGVGKCRDVRSGTMCPSYMATREEEHSTRGRARLLFEMLESGPIDEVWRSDEIREALDLCLACKGCKSECPVNVDMATYKAEFLSHHYEGRLRPRVAYSMGLIYWLARVASHVPGLANFVIGHRPFSSIAKKIAGVAPQRDIPGFASPPFRKWFQDREGRNIGTGERVILWPDTFNSYLDTSPARAAVRILEDAGFEVTIPERPLCCGRPLYDWGMLDAATRLWEQIFVSIGDDVANGVPVVGLEPSCVTSFRDELPGLFPDHPIAAALKDNTYLFSEFLVKHDYPVPPLHAKALVQGHCHHKAVIEMDAEMMLLDRMGIDHDLIDSGCCGMAGAFGFDDGHYEVSMRIGERVLLPAVRHAGPRTFVIADGFSCREQIKQTTRRQALHLSEVIEIALEAGAEGPAGSYPERYVGGRRPLRFSQSEKSQLVKERDRHG